MVVKKNLLVIAYRSGLIILYFLLVNLTGGIPACSQVDTDKSSASDRYVNFESFGAKANGEDETSVILKALQYAREKKLPVHLQRNRTYRFSPTQTVDITGIPAFLGEGTIDLSRCGPNAGQPSMNYVFTVSGKKNLLRSGIRIEKGVNKVVLGNGLDLKTGDIIFFTSIEPIANTKRKYNRKGQRAKVRSYEQASGLLTIEDSFYFDIGAASVWKLVNVPDFEVGKQVRFVTSKMNLLTCIQLIYANGKISGHYENFALAAIYFRSSTGIVEEADIKLQLTANNGYSYGVAVSDMSDVLIRNCKVEGGRHAICGTSGGLWRANESGGGSDEKLGYPAKLTINGGVYRTFYDVNAGLNESLGTIDSHGSVYYIRVENCTVYGGISLGAAFGEIKNVQIYPEKKRAFNIGSDVLPGSAWGNYDISDVEILLSGETDKSVLFGKSDVESVKLTDILLKGADANTLLVDFKDYAPKSIQIRGFDMKGGTQPKIWVNSKTKLDIQKSSIDKNAIRLIQREPERRRQEEN